MKDKIKQALAEAIRQVFAVAVPFEFDIIDPPASVEADLSTNVALILASQLKQKPDDIADKLANQIVKVGLVKQALAERGFINMVLAEDVLLNQIHEIVERNGDYGRLTSGHQKKARVEFVSANPTGPLHIGNARGGPLGDAIASVLEAAGYQVLREYLHNDIGGQVKNLGESIVGRGTQYQADYINELKQKIKTTDPEEAGKQAVEILFNEIMADCRAMGIEFDKVYKEHDFVLLGKTKGVLEKIESVLKKREGAIWFAPSNEFLKDRETVVVKSDGSYTYFANDIAYHDLKFAEGYDLVISVFGSNHHGHVPRLQAVIKALGYDVKKFKPILYQFVRVKRGKEVVKMSKRAGDFVTAREVLDEVGKDAFRFMMLMHDPNTHIDFDVDLAKKKSQENPVYYVQYAGVRAKHIIQKSKIKMQNDNSKVKIGDKAERKLVLQLLKFPDLVQEVSKTLRIHQLAQYAIETARVFHDFYEKLPVIKDGKVNRSRLALVQATLVVLENTLQLLGVSVPDRM